jgi:N-acetylmuramic acid 6-phosphate etherase
MIRRFSAIPKKSQKPRPIAPPVRDRMYAALPTEGTLRAAANLDAMPALRVARLMLREERKSARAAERAASEIACVAAAAAQALARGGRLIYIGAGTSGRLAVLDASECPPTFGVRPSQVVAMMAGGARAIRRSVEGAEDDEAAAVHSLTRLRVGAKDVVVGVAASGVTPFALAALRTARAKGALTALVTCAPAAARAAGAAADVMIGLEVGPEVLAGSTRLKAGTATKMALNAISSTAMVLLGKCYGPRMVDLRVTNAKLRARARRMITDLTRLSADEADRVLAASGRQVKVAIAMARLGIPRDQAIRRLRAAAGRLRAVIGSP